MARKIKFALEMADGAKVRGSIEELREHFDLDKAVEHFVSGKLAEWLADRYYENEAEALEAIGKDAPDLRARLCAALGVPYEGDDKGDAALDVDALERLNEKKRILRQKTSDEAILANADKTALTQEDLADLLDMDEPVIYLCGESFNIPARVENTKYIGVLGTPKVSIKANSQEELDAKGIVFENVKLPWAQETRPCPKCGEKNPLNAKFCVECGAAMTEAGTVSMSNDSSTLANSVKQDLLDIKMEFWKTKDIWQVVTHDGSPSQKALSNIQKKLYVNYVCNGAYSENEIIHIYVVDDMSAGWAFTTDAFCVAGTIKDYFTSFGHKIERLPYSQIKKIVIDLDTPEETNLLYINDMEYQLNCYWLAERHNTNLDENTLWRMAKFLDLARIVASQEQAGETQMKTMQYKTADDVMKLAKAEGYDLTEDEAKAYMNTVRMRSQY